MQLRPFLLVSSIVLLFVLGDTNKTTADEIPSASKTVLASELFDESILAENVFRVRQRALELPDDQRYQYLIDLVLPSDWHDTIRMCGAFTPTDPAPIVPPQYLDATGSGGTLVSPAFDLLDLAAKLGRLNELREVVATMAEPKSEAQRRAHAAIRILLALEMSEESAIESDVQTLRTFITTTVPKTIADQWPETLVAYRSVTKFPQSSACDILSDLVSHRMQRGIPIESAEWHSQIFSLAGRLKTYQLRETGLATESTDTFKHWIAVDRTRWSSVCDRMPCQSDEVETDVT